MVSPHGVHPWVIFPKPTSQVRLRLFCFPYAGGGASAYRMWPQRLPPTVAVCRIQLPGRENRLEEPAFTQLSPLVHAVADVLRPVLRPYLDIPVAFFGHSLGALIAFELTRQLRNRYGLAPVHLLVSGYPAPQLPLSGPPIHGLPASEFVDEVLSRYKGIPEEVRQNTELMELVLPALRADMAVYETYAYAEEAVLGCPISAFGGLEDRWVSREDLAAWRSQTGSSFALRMFPGDHFFLHSAEDLLLRAISQDLARHVSQRSVSF